MTIDFNDSYSSISILRAIKETWNSSYHGIFWRDEANRVIVQFLSMKEAVPDILNLIIHSHFLHRMRSCATVRGLNYSLVVLHPLSLFCATPLSCVESPPALLSSARTVASPSFILLSYLCATLSSSFLATDLIASCSLSLHERIQLTFLQ